MKAFSRAKRALLVSAALFMCSASSVAEDIKLPDFGSSASASISEKEEYYYALAVLRSMRNEGVLLEDPELVEYLRTLASRLSEASDKPENPVGFFMIKSDEFNAFAVPGGVIGVNSGLFLRAEKESELAAVLAHEVAHVTQKHSIRAMERSQKASLPVMLGTLALMAAASQSNSRSGSNAGEAAMISGMALMQQLQINYTRENEFEADRLGIRNLQRAGFDVTSMAAMFGRMQQIYRTSSGNQVPQYLRTHPLNATRVAEAKQRAQELLLGPVAEQDVYFQLLRERVRVLQNSGTTERLTRNLREDLQNRGESPVRRYGLALAYAKSGQFGKAKSELAKVQFPAVARPADANLLALSKELLRLEIAELSKQKAEWEPAFEKLLAAKPKHRVIGLRFAQALVTEGSDPSARRAIDVLRDLSTAYESDPSVYELMARAYELAGQTVRASEAYARAAAYRGALEDSLAQLETLTRRTDLSYYERARVDALIAEILPIVLEIRARENRSGPPRTG